MASLTLKNLPDELLEALRAAAARDRRSLTQETIHLLEDALRRREEPPSAASVEAQVAAWRRIAGRWESDLEAEEERAQVAEGRSGGREVDL